jgi:hypothetical protein
LFNPSAIKPITRWYSSWDLIGTDRIEHLFDGQPPCKIPCMGRTEKRLFRIADQVAALVAEREQVREELEFHRHIDDDAQRDAAVSGFDEDRLEATSTAADVRRFEKRLTDIDATLDRLEQKRTRLLAKLD